MSRLDPSLAAVVLSDVRKRRPRVHCLTNHVARAFTANVLLAVGAVPSMSADAEEVAEFVAGSDALLVNLGTLDDPMRAAIDVAMDVATGSGVPVVLDPVFADRSEGRAVFGRRLLRQAPAALRCNCGEARVLGDPAVDSAMRAGTILALSGPVDRISGQGRTMELEGGHPLMASVTAMGCALGAVIAACLSTGEEPFDAVVAGCGVFKMAGAKAGAGASGPGTFVPGFLDALYEASQAEDGEGGCN